MDKTLSLVIPMYNEADNVAPMLARVHEALAAYPAPWELIVIDDGSQDATALRLREGVERYGTHVRAIHLARNQGQTAAMQAGIDAARGELIATLDGDLQNDPADIPRMVQELEDRELDLLCGRRAHRQDDFLMRKLPSRIANILIAGVTGVQISDYGCSLKLYRSETIKKVRLYGEMHRLIPVWIAMVTTPTRIGETDVRHHARSAGHSKYGLGRAFRVLLDLLTTFFFLKFRARPGHFFGGLGMIFGALGSLGMGWLAVVKFVYGEHIGGRPLLLISMLLLMFSVQLVSTGVIAEMLTRVFQLGRSASVSGEDARPAVGGWHQPEALPDASRPQKIA